MIRHLCWCVVVGCCVRTFGTRCLVFGDTLFLIMDLQVCVCVCVCTLLVSLGRLGINVHTLDLNLDFLHFRLQRRFGRCGPLLL